MFFDFLRQVPPLKRSFADAGSIIPGVTAGTGLFKRLHQNPWKIPDSTYSRATKEWRMSDSEHLSEVFERALAFATTVKAIASIHSLANRFKRSTKPSKRSPRREVVIGRARATEDMNISTRRRIGSRRVGTKARRLESIH